MKHYKTQIIIVVIILAVVIGIMAFAPATDTDQTTDESNITSGGGISSGTQTSGTQTQFPKTTHVVSYTSTGFSPSLLEIHAGDIVRFVNNSNGTLWVTTKGHPTLPDQNYSELDSGKSLAPGESFSLPLLRNGTWGYINLNNKNHRGAIAVQPQE